VGSGAGPVSDGLATLTEGVGGGVVVVTVCAVGLGCGDGVSTDGSAELAALNATPSTPIAIAAPAPTDAETSLKRVVFTTDHPFQLSGAGLHCGVAGPSQFMRGIHRLSMYLSDSRTTSGSNIVAARSVRM
jgi:hypothetical protein